MLNEADLLRFTAYLDGIWATTDGWFDVMAASTCDSLLCFQEEVPLNGHFLEIGAWHGKSAGLWGVHLAEQECLHLIDTTPDREAIAEALRRAAAIRAKGDEIKVDLQEVSSLFIQSLALYPAKQHSFRWIHIDGNHTGSYVYSDLESAEALLMEDGVICIDDFFSPWYPQVTQAVFRYLDANPYRLSLFLVGFGKGFLARPMAVHHYLDYCAQRLPEEMNARMIKQGSENPYRMRRAVLVKTTRPGDMNCFGITHAPAGFRGSRRGLDWDTDSLPY